MQLLKMLCLGFLTVTAMDRNPEELQDLYCYLVYEVLVYPNNCRIFLQCLPVDPDEYKPEMEWMDWVWKQTICELYQSADGKGGCREDKSCTDSYVLEPPEPPSPPPRPPPPPPPPPKEKDPEGYIMKHCHPAYKVWVYSYNCRVFLQCLPIDENEWDWRWVRTICDLYQSADGKGDCREDDSCTDSYGPATYPPIIIPIFPTFWPKPPGPEVTTEKPTPTTNFDCEKHGASFFGQRRFPDPSSCRHFIECQIVPGNWVAYRYYCSKKPFMIKRRKRVN